MTIIETAAADAIGTAVPGAGIVLRLLGGVKTAGSFLLHHPALAIAIVAAALAGVEHHDAAKWHSTADRATAALSAVRSANAQAVNQATAAKEIKDAQNTRLAAASDRTAAALHDRYHAAVVQLAAAQDRARRADLPGHADPAQGSDGPGEGTGLPAADPGTLTISTADALTCGENTARLQAVHDWAAGITP